MMSKTPSFKATLAILLSGIWVNFSEFARNELLVKSIWVKHYTDIGLAFPSDPINAFIWIVWGFLYAWGIYLVSKKFSLAQTTILSWLFGFVLMWLVTWNMGVLPAGILPFAIPLSLLEAFICALICMRMAR